MKRALLLSVALVFGAACGGGGGTDSVTAPPSNPAPPAVASVSVTLATAQLVAGASTTATSEVRSANGTVLTGRSVTWSSSAPSVATVDGSGTVSAVAPGSASITATSEGRSGSAALTVTPVPVATVVVVLAETSVIVGNVTTATASPRAANGAPLDGRVVTWASTNTSVATVDGTGRITAVAPGTTSISAASEGQTGTASLTVLPVPVASVSVSGPTSLAAGSVAQLAATPRDGTGAELQGRNVVWGTSNTSVATVGATGLVTGVAPGTVTISASSEGRTGTLLLEVRSAVVGVTLAGNFRVKVGDSYQYTATARASDGSTVVRPVSWSTVNPGAGTFTASGLFTPATTGTITIVATIDGVNWEGTVTAYDWLSLSGSGSLFASLPSDNQITNQFGSSEYPELTFACSSTGSFLAWVSTERFITANGIVAFAFDGGAAVGQTWLEFNNFRALGKTGTNASVKAFASQMAAARLFTFGFGEFRSTTKVVSFRVTGLGPRLAPLFNACPGNNIESVVADALRAASSSVASMAEPSPELLQLQRERERAKPSSTVLTLDVGASFLPRTDSQTARRKR